METKNAEFHNGDKILTEIGSDAIIDAIDKNLTAFRLLFSKLPKAQLFEYDHVTYLNTGVPFAKLNGVLVTKLNQENADVTINEIKEYFHSKKIPMSWWVGHSTEPPDLDNYLKKHGFTLVDSSPAMACELNDDPSMTNGNPDLDFRMVSNQKELSIFLNLLKESYQLPKLMEDAVLTLFSIMPLEENTCCMNYIGYDRSKPVACSTLFINAGVAGIYHIGTSPDLQGKGYGTAITRYTMRVARDRRFRVAILRASQQGLSIYKKLGFTEYYQLHQYCSDLSLLGRVGYRIKYFGKKGFEKFKSDALWFS
jgi:GNAT superfamily N-acetyltransferase